MVHRVVGQGACVAKPELAGGSGTCACGPSEGRHAAARTAPPPPSRAPQSTGATLSSTAGHRPSFQLPGSASPATHHSMHHASMHPAVATDARSPLCPH